MAKVALSNLNPIQKLILDKIEFLEARDQVEKGVYDIDLDLHVEGKIKIGENFWQVVWTKMRPLVILQYAMNKLNAVTRQTVLEEAFDWYSKLSDAEREEIDAGISGQLKAAEESLKVKTTKEKEVLEKKLAEAEAEVVAASATVDEVTESTKPLPTIKDKVKVAVNEMKCWTISECRGRVSFSNMKIEVKEVTE